MLVLVMKCLLALSALIVALLGVLDLKSMATEDPVNPKPWWRRLTGWGVTKIACALVTFGLLAANEYQSYRSAFAAKQLADDEQTKLHTKLESAAHRIGLSQQAIGAAIVKISELARGNEYLVRTLDNSMIRVGSVRLPATQIKEPIVELKFQDGRVVEPKRGDDIEWAFVCHNGDLPTLEDPALASCRPHGYGRLMANGFAIPLIGRTGKGLFFGTRSTGGPLEYRSTGDDLNPDCLHIALRLERSQCELHLTVTREARWLFRDAAAATPSQSPAQAVQDLCRKYEALYGISCEDLLKR